ncbi:zinc finger E-box-binding homeobox 1 [Biomphalaria pfeifferi]|uniref:Zinc finger E-box-binding homeobox 1 n=1 Tax=Biomphalaria pfeifferi TaxID=112525 RepID=A0AAD8BT33_BIOPF|nr:zinc finger E-box-binding homeobox 1 [Biomphalaria pfeifferi]
MSLDEEKNVNTTARLEEIPEETNYEISQNALRNRPFACLICNKRFTQKAHLIIHKRIHTGEKPYSCHICHRKFAQSSHLTVHKRVHTGEKPFFCNFCGMGFCRRPRLEAHILQHVVKEGRQIPSTLKGNMLKNLSMVGLDNVDTPSSMSLNVSNQFGDLKESLSLEIKTEPPDDIKSSAHVLDEICEMTSECDPVRKRRKPEFVRKLRSNEKLDILINGDNEDKIKDEVHLTNGKNLLRLSSEDIEKITHSLTDLTELNKHFQQTSSKTVSSVNNILSPYSRLHHNPTIVSSGLARTNSRISLVDFTADDILQHLMTRDDVRSCSFCCIVFHDPAMYYLHRSMHDKMDVRCCNLCGKLLVDKYDFTAHFLNQHK